MLGMYDLTLGDSRARPLFNLVIKKLQVLSRMPFRNDFKSTDTCGVKQFIGASIMAPVTALQLLQQTAGNQLHECLKKTVLAIVLHCVSHAIL